MDLDQIYQSCHSLIKAYEGKGFQATKETPSEYRIASCGDFEVSPGRRMKQIEFAAIAKRKGSVAFYFMPVYMNDPLGKKLSPVLMNCLSGKACFHFTKWDAEMEGAVADALEKGIECYEVRGWVG